MIRVLILTSFVLATLNVQAQFWLGPTAGVSITQRNYQDKTWKQTYDIPNTLSTHVGFIMNYTTHEVFSIHTELFVERLSNSVNSKPDSAFVSANSQFTTINAPFLLRYRIPINHYLSGYINVGPKLTYWLSGSGDFITDDELFVQEGEDAVDYQIRFSGRNDLNEGIMVLENPKRLKYSLELGAGFYIDLIGHNRIMLDARLSLGHSFMSFNRGSETFGRTGEETDYFENFEYRTNMLRFSVAYLFGFDPIDSKRGRNSKRGKKSP